MGEGKRNKMAKRMKEVPGSIEEESGERYVIIDRDKTRIGGISSDKKKGEGGHHIKS